MRYPLPLLMLPLALCHYRCLTCAPAAPVIGPAPCATTRNTRGFAVTAAVAAVHLPRTLTLPAAALRPAPCYLADVTVPLCRLPRTAVWWKHLARCCRCLVPDGCCCAGVAVAFAPNACPIPLPPCRGCWTLPYALDVVVVAALLPTRPLTRALPCWCSGD